MGSLRVSLNRLGAGSKTLEPAQISSPHVDSTEQCLKKIFRKHFSAPPEKAEFKVKFQIDKPVLCYQGKEVPLENSEALKRIARTVRCYQHSGHLPRLDFKSEAKSIAESKSKKSTSAVHGSSIPGTSGQILAGVGIAQKAISLTKNILLAHQASAMKNPIIAPINISYGYYTGGFQTIFAMKEITSGVTGYIKSKTIGDGEGIRRSQASILTAGVVATASVGYLIGNACAACLSKAPASAILLGGSTAFFGLGSLLGIGSSLLGAFRCSTLNKRINEYRYNTKLSEAERLKASLKLLKECISVTPEEKEKLSLQIEKENPDSSKEFKENLLKQMLSDLTETKVKYMNRRTSSKSLMLLLNKADDILKKLESSESVVEGIVKATELIDTIQKEIRIKQSLCILGSVAAIVSFVAMVFISIGTFGALPFIFYGISAGMYLLISIYTAMTMSSKKDLQEEPVKPLPVEEKPIVSVSNLRTA